MSRRKTKLVSTKRAILGIGITAAGIALGLYVYFDYRTEPLLVLGSYGLMILGAGVAGLEAKNIS